MSNVDPQSLFWIALGALFIPMISRRINVPSAVGELIYGMMFGPHLLEMIRSDPFINTLAQLGFAFLMFNAGMEIDFAPLRKKGSKLLGTGWQWAALTFIVAAGGGYFLGIGPWAVLAVCSVSIGLASVFLRERQLLTGALGQAILAGGLIGESLSILLLTVLDFRSRLGMGLEFFVGVAQFTGIFALAYILMRVFRFIIWWYPRKVQSFVESGDPLELGVRLSVALLFIFVAFAAALEVEAILGAFIAGALFGFIFQEREVVAEKMNAIGQGFLVPFFFIVVGSHFDPVSSIKTFSMGDFGKLIALALAAKLAPAFLFMRAGLTVREVLAAGFLFAAPLTLTVAVAEVGVRVGAIDRDLQGSLILVAIFTGLFMPFLARVVLPRSERKPDEEG